MWLRCGWADRKTVAVQQGGKECGEGAGMMVDRVALYRLVSWCVCAHYHRLYLVAAMLIIFFECVWSTCKHLIGSGAIKVGKAKASEVVVWPDR